MDIVNWFIDKGTEIQNSFSQTKITENSQNNIQKSSSESDIKKTTPPPQQQISNKKQILFNYYQTFATKLQPSYTGYIHYSLPGKENEPNLTIENTNYVSKDLYIFSKIHDYPNIEHFDGELVIINTPITNGDKPIYICFPLKYTPNAPKNILYQLLSEDDIKNQEINMNSILPLDGLAYYYETAYSNILVSHMPIPIAHNFVGFNRGKIDDLWELPTSETSIVRLSKKSTYASNIDITSPFTVSIISPPSNKIIEGMEDKKMEDAMCDASYCYFDCAFSDVELKNEVPTYTIKAGSDNISYQEQALNYSVSIVWLITVMLITAYLGPLIFSIIGTRKLRLNDDEENINILDRIEGGLGQLLLIPGIVLLSVGVPNNLKCPSGDTDCFKEANKLILPGTILLSLWVFYALSLLLNKILYPDFLGYRVPGDTSTAFFKYDKNTTHFLHHFYPYSLFMFFFYILGWD